MQFLLKLLLFLGINFGALGVGSLFTNSGVSSEWYQSLDKAPWTPPGWVFGASWTLIMVCFSIWLAYLWPKVQDRSTLVVLYVIQLFLNIGWNPLFFHYKATLLALFVISALTILIIFLFGKYWNIVSTWSLLLLPYALWLVIATSLNAYIVFNN